MYEELKKLTTDRANMLSDENDRDLMLAPIAIIERLECMLEHYKIDAKIYKDSSDQLRAENEMLRKECARLAEDNRALLENPGDAL